MRHEAVIPMSPFACFSRDATVTALTNRIPCIFALSSKEEMIRSNTLADVAGMENQLVSGRPFAMRKKPRNVRGDLLHFGNGHFAMPIIESASKPKPTILSLVN